MKFCAGMAWAYACRLLDCGLQHVSTLLGQCVHNAATELEAELRYGASKQTICQGAHLHGIDELSASNTYDKQASRDAKHLIDPCMQLPACHPYCKLSQSYCRTALASADCT